MVNAEENVEKVGNILLPEHRVEINTDTKEIKLINKKTFVERVISVNDISLEGVYHLIVNSDEDLAIIGQMIIYGYFVLQPKKDLQIDLPKNELFLLEGVRLRHPLYDFESNMIVSAKYTVQKMAENIDEAENVLLDFCFYIGMCYARTKNVSIQISNTKFVKLDEKMKIELPIIMFLLLIIRECGLPYKQEKLVRNFLSEYKNVFESEYTIKKLKGLIK